MKSRFSSWLFFYLISNKNGQFHKISLKSENELCYFHWIHNREKLRHFGIIFRVIPQQGVKFCLFYHINSIILFQRPFDKMQKSEITFEQCALIIRVKTQDETDERFVQDLFIFSNKYEWNEHYIFLHVNYDFAIHNFR